MIYYLSGPMSGIPENNFQAFKAATGWLRVAGYTVVSPHEKGSELDCLGTYVNFLKEDVVLLAGCDALILLQGWPTSTGARMELELALTWKLPIYFLAEDPYELINMMDGTS